ncbi:muscle M-line assembly protein unc-89 [Aplysia californica]|uniref:Muscle M-line assembly protein unc-89 n=1 Tax=Aplysia californica TaxID=6500 RepID=A0ABM1AD70_APLCA|nr:muscle M-line assembly protein unc-89 [Aplysia californica]
MEAGSSIKISTTIEGTPKPEVTWSKDDKMIKDGGRFSVTSETDTYSLEIREATETDSGSYKVTALSSVGESSSTFEVSVAAADVSVEEGKKRKPSEEVDPRIPRFDVEPQNVTVADFESVKLVCEVKGDPAPTVTWEKDGRRVRSSRRVRLYESRGSYYLEIPDSEAQDSGEYVCTATNSHGTVTHAVKVQVGDVIASASVPEEEAEKPAALVVDAESDISSSKVMEEETSLEFSSSVDIEESKKPQPTVEVVDEESKPRVLGKLEDVKVEAGGSVKISTNIEGTPRPEVMWSKGEEILKDDNRYTMTSESDVYTLEIKDATEADTGTYRVTALNSAGETHTDIEICVASTVVTSQTTEVTEKIPSVEVDPRLPRFEVAPENASVAEFEAVKLVCAVQGDPEPTVTWEKDGRRVRSSRMVRLYESRGSYYLEIPDSEAQDSGEYVCTATNSHGTVTHAVKVCVGDIETVEPAKEEETEKLAIQTESEVSSTKITEEKTFLETSSSVDVEESQVTQLSAEVTEVESKPMVVDKLEDVKVEAGSSIKISTTIEGTPKPEVTWSRVEQTIQASDHYSMTSENDVYTLEIKDATKEDAGTYTVTALSSAGKTTSDFEVSVTGTVETEKTVRAPSPEADPRIPKFVLAPEDVNVAEFDSVKLVCTPKGDPAPTVTWEKDGRRVRSSRRVRLYESRGSYYLEIPDSEAQDSGEYVCTATNSHGTVSHTVSVSVGDETAKEEEIDESSSALDIPEAMMESSDDTFLKVYLMLTDYTDPDTSFTFSGGEQVELLDSRQKSGMWLVRGREKKEKVMFVPSSLLCIASAVDIAMKMKEESDDGEVAAETSQKKKERKLTHSPKSGSTEFDMDTSEDELRLRGIFPDFVAVADFNPVDKDNNTVRLSEGQIVEVIDQERADSWLVRTRPTKSSPSKQGWVPSAYLEEKAVAGQFSKRSTRETFREEVLQVKNKQQEATLKRRYLLKELEETEREYVKDLKSLIEEYVEHIASSSESVPEAVAESAESVFSNISEIFNFHDSQFSADLAECITNPSAIGATFLKRQSEFDNYIRYLSDRDAASFLLDSADMKEFLKEFCAKKSENEDALLKLLQRPVDRLKMYQLLLKDVLRYSVRAGEDCREVEAAVAMLIAIERAVGHGKLLPLLEGLEGDITQLGTLLRHDDFLEWDGDVTTSRVKDRHAFLFSDKVILTKKKKPDSASDQLGFSYRAAIDLVDVRVNECVAEDERKFELWFTGDSAVEKLTLQARSVYAKQAWVKDIRESLIKLGVTEPDRMPERTTEVPEEETPSVSSSATTPTGSAGQDLGSEVTKLQESEPESDRTKTDADSYESEVTDSQTGTETEKVTGPFFKQELKKVVCQEGRSARLECTIGGSPKPTVSWTKGGKPIKEGDGISFIVEGDTCILEFSEPSSTNSGTYTVTLSSEGGSAHSSVDLFVVEDVTESETGSETAAEDIDSSWLNGADDRDLIDAALDELNETVGEKREEEISSDKKVKDDDDEAEVEDTLIEVEIIKEEEKEQPQEDRGKTEDTATTEKAVTEAVEEESVEESKVLAKEKEEVQVSPEEGVGKTEVAAVDIQSTQDLETEVSLKNTESKVETEEVAVEASVEKEKETPSGTVEVKTEDQQEGVKVSETQSKEEVAEIREEPKSEAKEEKVPEAVEEAIVEAVQEQKKAEVGVEEKSKPAEEEVKEEEKEIRKPRRFEEDVLEEREIKLKRFDDEPKKKEEEKEKVKKEEEEVVPKPRRFEEDVLEEREIKLKRFDDEPKKKEEVKEEKDEVKEEEEVRKPKRFEEDVLEEREIKLKRFDDEPKQKEEATEEKEEVKKEEEVRKPKRFEEDVLEEREIKLKRFDDEPKKKEEVKEEKEEVTVEEEVRKPRKFEEDVLEEREIKLKRFDDEPKKKEEVKEEKEEVKEEEEVRKPKRFEEDVLEEREIKLKRFDDEPKKKEELKEEKEEKKEQEEEKEEVRKPKKFEEDVLEEREIKLKRFDEEAKKEEKVEEKEDKETRQAEETKPVKEEETKETVEEKQEVRKPKKFEEDVLEEREIKLKRFDEDEKKEEPKEVKEEAVKEEKKDEKEDKELKEEKEEVRKPRRFEEDVLEEREIKLKRFEEEPKEKKEEPVKEKEEVKEEKKEVAKQKEEVKEEVKEEKEEVRKPRRFEEDVLEEREIKLKKFEEVKEEKKEVKKAEEVKEEEKVEAKKESRKPAAPQFKGSMDNCVTELGDMARFDCRVSAYPDPNITWFKDGHKVTASDKHELVNFHDDIFSLLIKKVDMDDGGRYTCLAKNEYGEAKSEALLNVVGLKEKIKDAHVAPTFLTKFYDMEAVEGVPVEFVCVVDGNPDPVVTWILNGKEVENSSEILTRRQDDSVMLAFR